MNTFNEAIVPRSEYRYEWNLDVLHLPCHYYNVTYWHQLRCFSSIHKSSFLFQWARRTVKCLSTVYFRVWTEVVDHPGAFHLLFFEQYEFRHTTDLVYCFCILYIFWLKMYKKYVTIVKWMAIQLMVGVYIIVTLR